MKRLSLHIARILLVALVLNMVLVSFGRTAHAHEHGHAHQHVYVPDDVVVQTKLPEGSVIWKFEDYARWFSAARLSETDQDRLSWERTQGESPTILIMTLADYQKWVSSLDPDIARVVEENAVRVRASELPSTMFVQRLEDGLFVEDTMALSEEEYVILQTWLDWCEECLDWLIFIGETCYEGAWWVKALKVLRLIVRFIKRCSQCGWIRDGWVAEKDTQCPYIRSCMGEYAWVVRTDGNYAECACECGAHWYASLR